MIPVLIAQNIETIEFQLNSKNKRYYFPDDSRLANKVLSTIESFYSFSDADSEIITPSGREVLDYGYLQSCYLTIVSKRGRKIISELPLSSIAFTNAFKAEIFESIDLTKSYVVVMGEIPDNSSIFLAMYYNSQDHICFKEPNCCEQISITIDPLKNEKNSLGQQIELSEKKIKRIEAVNIDKGTLITIVTKDNLVIRDVPLFRFQKSSSGNTICKQLYFNDLNIDFERSFITNIVSVLAFGTNPIILNFYYYES